MRCMEKTTLSRTPSFRAHSPLQPKTGYNPAFRGPTGELQNALNNDGADQAPGGPIQTAVSPGDLLDRYERENDSRVTRYVHPLNVGCTPTCVRPRVTTPALMVMLCPPNHNSKHNGGAEPCSPPSTHTEPISHENATDDRKITHGGLEPCSPPESRSMTTVRSPAPRSRRRPNHTIQHAYTRCDAQVRPLHTIALVLKIIAYLIRNCDGGVEPCSPPINNTTLTTYKTNITNHGQVNGGAERCSPPGTRTPTTVRSPAPPAHGTTQTTP